MSHGHLNVYKHPVCIQPISCTSRLWIYFSKSVEQNQPAHPCSLILLCNLRCSVIYFLSTKSHLQSFNQSKSVNLIRNSLSSTWQRVSFVYRHALQFDKAPFLTTRLQTTTYGPLDQDQTAKKVQSNLGFTLFNQEIFLSKNWIYCRPRIFFYKLFRRSMV